MEKAKKESLIKAIKYIIATFVIIYLVAQFALLIFAVIAIVNCNKAVREKDNFETYGDFLYSVEYYDEDGNRVIKDKGVRSGIMIMGLSEAGKEKEIIVLPEYINDLKVEQLGYELFWGSKGDWESEKLNKVIISTPVSMIKGIFSGCINLEKIILLSHDEGYDIDGSGIIPVYLTSYHYSEENITNYYWYDYYFSNVSFLYNYVNAPNGGYYWIDDCDYGSRIDYIPESPVREGYTFDGWYKQPECIDAWDFEIDTLPQARYTEDNEEIYQETKLYAKWIKN